MPSSSQVAAAKGAPVVAAAPSVALSQMIQAEKILDSLKVGQDGFINLTFPAGLSDIEAMKALNVYFREKFPIKNRAAIWEGDLNWHAKQPGVTGREDSMERSININPLVKGTTGKDRTDQEVVLKKAGMTFAAPEEVALVVAAYACKYSGADLLKDVWTKTAASGVALTTNEYCGVFVYGHFDGEDCSFLGASGVALPAN